jgi:hypothetical protein
MYNDERWRVGTRNVGWAVFFAHHHPSIKIKGGQKKDVAHLQLICSQQKTVESGKSYFLSTTLESKN